MFCTLSDWIPTGYLFNSILLFRLTNNFITDIKNKCIYVESPYYGSALKWVQYNTLYFSNGSIGVYDPKTIIDKNFKIEFETENDVLNLKAGLYFSWLNQFDLKITNSELIECINNYKKDKKYEINKINKS